MTRTPLKNRRLPNYTRSEEIANMVTHIVGGGIGVIVLVASVLVAALHRNVWGVVGASIYGASMIALYSVSSVYHGLKPGYGKKVMQVLDHCTIYLLIAGTYTPILLSAMRPNFPVTAWVIFGIEWGLVAVATVFTAIDHRKFRVMSMIGYIGLGWCIIFAAKPAIQSIGLAGFWWIIAGGISYTVGAVLYMIGSKKPVFHTIFHLFVDLGSIFHAIAIIFYVL